MHHEPALEQPANGGSDLVAVLVHGRGRKPGEMRTLAGEIGLGGIRCVFPAAEGSSWYPQGFMAPIGANEPQLGAAIAHVEGIVAGLLAEGVPPGRILLGGFSQGACLTAELLARHPRAYAGALLFTGGLIGPPGTQWPSADLTGLPVYLTTSRIDEWVPPGRVEETAEWLKASFADVTLRIFEDRPHIVCDEEIVAARGLVARLLT